MGDTKRGNVKWFNDAKGYGFIESDKGDVFVHYSVIEASGFKTLKDGEEVEYELDAGEKGLHAKKVVRVNAPILAAPVDGQEIREQTPSKGLASQIEIERIPAPQQEEGISTAAIPGSPASAAK